MADWRLEGPYIKNCNCDPGCPCDFNANPTHGNCEGMAAMIVERGHFDDVNLDGVKWAMKYWWPGALHEGHGAGQPILDASMSPEQMEAMGAILSGQNGGTFYGILAEIIDTFHDPVIAPSKSTSTSSAGALAARWVTRSRPSLRRSKRWARNPPTTQSRSRSRAASSTTKLRSQWPQSSRAQAQSPSITKTATAHSHTSHATPATNPQPSLRLLSEADDLAAAVIHPMLSHDNNLARRTSRERVPPPAWITGSAGVCVSRPHPRQDDLKQRMAAVG